MASKQPRFFCDFCGTEVKRNDRICPNCGKFFSAVRCPSCGLTGQAALFVKGCPSCGYAVLPGSEGDGSANKKKKRKNFRPRRDTAGKSRPAGDPLPFWVYLAVIVLFVAVVVGVANLALS